MDADLRRDIVDFLIKTPSLQSENGRKSALLYAGLDNVLHNLDLPGAPRDSLMMLVNALDGYGTSDDIPALIVFLKSIAGQLGMDRQTTLQEFCERYIQSQANKSQREQPQRIICEAVTISPQPEKSWDVFVCHAWEDKEEIARPLAEALQNAGLRVWYDEFSLGWGESLSDSISRGVEDSRYGLVILSRPFFNKPWPQKELDKLAARERAGEKVILPLWHKIDRDDVAEFSEKLADRKAERTDDGVAYLVNCILKKLGNTPHETQDMTTKKKGRSQGSHKASFKRDHSSKIIHWRKALGDAIIWIDSEPLTVSAEMAAEEFEILNILSGYPEVYIENKFEDQGNCIIDHATALIWQKSGLTDSVVYSKAHSYIQDLNRQGFDGYKNWRLPTVPELISLIDPQLQTNQLHIDPLFDKKQGSCWSADSLLKQEEEEVEDSVWIADFINGIVSVTSKNASNFVRAVCSCFDDKTGRLLQVPMSSIQHTVHTVPCNECTFLLATIDPRGENYEYERGTAFHYLEIINLQTILDMIYIPGGDFMMGSPKVKEDDESDEFPEHQVTLSPFFIGRYPVTRAQWHAIMQPEFINIENPQRPIEQVSWENATEFCRRISAKSGASYRLPTEAEWEYACRAGTITSFYFGETITPRIANYDGTKSYGLGPKGEPGKAATDVGSFWPNKFGLHDMHGNVWEWCQDYWHYDYYGRSPRKDPLCEQTNLQRICRGGGWDSGPKLCRSANRGALPPGETLKAHGFRVVRTIF